MTPAELLAQLRALLPGLTPAGLHARVLAALRHEYSADLDAVYRLQDEGRHAEASAAVDALAVRLGEDHPEIGEARTYLALTRYTP